MALQVAAAGGAGPGGRDHLDELVAEVEHRVVDAELGHAGVTKRRRQVQQRGQRLAAGRQVMGGKNDLADTHGRPFHGVVDWR